MKLDTCCLRTEAADCVAQYEEQHCCCPSEVWCAASAAQSHREPASKRERESVKSERYICCSFYLLVYVLFNECVTASDQIALNGGMTGD